MRTLFTHKMALTWITIFVLLVLIFLLLIAILAVIYASRKAENKRKMKMSLEKMKRLGAAVSQINLQNIKAENQEISKEIKTEKKKLVKENGDRTIYDDRKKLNRWQIHLSDTYREMKKKNPKTTFRTAMKAAKKTYKKAKK